MKPLRNVYDFDFLSLDDSRFLISELINSNSAISIRVFEITFSIK